MSPPSLNEFFEHKVVINLDRRPDRLEEVRSEFARHGIGPVERFAAVDGATAELPPEWSIGPGHYGCLLSHIAVVREARRRGARNVLIFEDDVVFDPELNGKFARYAPQVPADWDMLSFGNIHIEDPVPVTENVYRIRKSHSTYAYALNLSVYDRFLALNMEHPDAVDANNTILAGRCNYYCFMPHLAWVADGYSDLRGHVVRYGWLRESLLLSGEELAGVLKRTAFVLWHFARPDDPIAPRRLAFLARYYRDNFPTSRVVIVERADRPSLSTDLLPEGCGYAFAGPMGRRAPGGAAPTGLRDALDGASVFYHTGSEVFAYPKDIKSNLLVLKRYDFATSFHDLIELGEADTRLFLDDLKNIDTGRFEGRRRVPPWSGSCAFTDNAAAALGPFGSCCHPCEDPARAARVLGSLKLFESPNTALRLWSGTTTGYEGGSGRAEDDRG